MPKGRLLLAVMAVGVSLIVAANFAEASQLKAGENFWDCDDCPEMIVIPAGSFVMGDDTGRPDEKPARKIQIEKAFALGAFEVTFAEWQACHESGGCSHMPDDHGWGTVARPVIGVSWRDVQEYLRWVSEKSGFTYRLPTETEWEYATRAGTNTQYWWGDKHEDAQASFCGSKWDTKRTAPVGTFPANAFGLYDVHGNVWEWTTECYDDEADGQCERVIRGGSWQTYPLLLRSARRQPAQQSGRYADVGFRVLREIP